MAGGIPHNQVRVPPEYNPAKAPPMRNEFTLKSDDQSPEKVALARRQERENETDHNFARGGLSAEVGRIATGDGAARQIAGEAQSAEEKERKERTDRAMLLAALNDQIADYDFQLGIGSEFADDLANGILPDLDEEGRIANEDREAFIQAYEERTGETVDRADIDALRAAVDAQNEYLHQARAATAEQRAAIDRSDRVSAAEQDRNLTAGGITAFIQQTGMQAAGETSDVSENNQVEELRSLEDEVSEFMQDYARAQGMGNDRERLEVEQGLVSSLSDEAADLISFSEDTEHLFEEGYFAALERSPSSENLPGNEPLEAPSSSI